MIFWIFVVLFVIALIWEHFNDDSIASVGVSALCGIITAIMLFGIIISNIAPNAQIKKYEQRYESLVYQYENNLYDNDNDLGKKELMNQIQEWNEDLALRKEAQGDFWIGIFYPNIFDNFDFIELE